MHQALTRTSFCPTGNTFLMKIDQLINTTKESVSSTSAISKSIIRAAGKSRGEGCSGYPCFTGGIYAEKRL